MAVTAAQRRSAQLHLRRWQSQRRQSLLRFAQAQSKSALALFKRLASKPEPSQCPEQRHWLHCTCQPIVSRISCDLALAGCCMAGSECSRPQVACSRNGAAPLAPQHVPAHRESHQLRPCSSWVPYGSHSGAAAIGAVAPASAAVAQLHLRRECAARICVGGSECSRPQVARVRGSHLRRWLASSGRRA